MKKGVKFIKVEITSNGGTVAYTIDKKGAVSRFALTRTQRDIFEHYNNRDFIERVRAEFNADVLDENFIITKHGNQVYPPKKEDE